MRNCLSWAVLPLLAAACAAPRAHLDEGTYGAERVASEGTPAALAAARPVLQEPDYSPSGMFMDAHGDFMLKRRRYRPMIAAEVLWQPNSDIDNEPGHFDLFHYQFDARVPLALDPDSFIELGGYFNARQYETDSRFPINDNTLYDVGVRLGGGTFVNEDLLLEGSFYPGIYSDFDDTLTKDDYQWYFDAVAVWRTQEDLFWKFGVSHNGLFKELEVYPMLGVGYAISPRWRIDAMLPRNFEVSYSPSAETILMAGVTLDGNQYEVHGAGDTASHVQELRVGLGAIHRFNDIVSLFGRVGAVVAGDYSFLDGNGNRADGQLEPGVFFSLGVGVDF